MSMCDAEKGLLPMHCLISPMCGSSSSQNPAFLSTTSPPSTTTFPNPDTALLEPLMIQVRTVGAAITTTWHSRSTSLIGEKGLNGLNSTENSLSILIAEDAIYNIKFEAFCKPSCYVDEHYFPTMLNIQAPSQLANRSITWVDWSRGGAHPATFGKGDITEEFFKKVFQRQNCSYNDKPSSICFLFGRKFAPSTLEPLIPYIDA